MERVWKKIKGWKEKFLSRAGKEVLIKAVAQVIPTYVMSCYKVPESVFHEIEAMLARFWWGSKNGERKVFWLSREKLSKSKSVEGMGFRGISEFNQSLLGKQYWRLLEEENSLAGRVMKGRYYPRTNLENSNSGFRSSYAWRSIQCAKELVQRGSRWRIGNGKTVRVFDDRWIPCNPGFKVRSPRINLSGSCVIQ